MHMRCYTKKREFQVVGLGFPEQIAMKLSSFFMEKKKAALYKGR